MLFKNLIIDVGPDTGLGDVIIDLYADNLTSKVSVAGSPKNAAGVNTPSA